MTETTADSDSELPHLPRWSLNNPRTFWLGLGLILLLAGAARLWVYPFSIPYIDHADEPNFYLAGLEIRGHFDNHGYYIGYPPAYIYLNAAAQTVLEPLGVKGAGYTVGALRFLAVWVNLATLVFIALAGREGGGNIAGWGAGTLWGVSSVVLTEGIYASPDPFVFMFVALSFWLAAAALKEEHAHFALWSVVAALVAFLFKYHVLTAVVPGTAVMLWHVFKGREKARRLLVIQILLTALVLGGFALYIFNVDAEAGLFAEGSGEGANFRSGGLANLVNSVRVWQNIRHSWWPVGQDLWLAGVGVGLAAYLFARWRSQERVSLAVAEIALFLIISVPWAVTSFSKVDGYYRIKDVLPVTTACCVLFGMALAQLALLRPSSWPIQSSLLALLLLLPVAIPQISLSLPLITTARQTDSRVLMRQWADDNIEPPGLILVTFVNEKTFNPFWGGIPFRYWFDTLREDDISALAANPPADWRSRGVHYVVLENWEAELLTTFPDGGIFLESIYPMKSFGGPLQRGPDMTIYAMEGPQHEVLVTFGDTIRLIGYDSGSKVIPAGEAFSLRLYWNAFETPDANLSLFIHLVDSSGQLISQVDANPGMPGRLTPTWTDPNETLIDPPRLLRIPGDVPAGDYQVRVGLYDFATGQRLPVMSEENAAGDSYLLLTISVP
jgi:hypothetical protein